MNNSLISVIVPIYNVENYIEKCVKSICDQTYDNLQIILVDDGATDRSGKIADELAANDQRIEVHHKKNGGLSSARNEGLKFLKGDYIMFIDSDDYIATNMCETLLFYAQTTGSDLTECGFYRVFTSHDEVEQPSAHAVTISGNEATKGYLLRTINIQSAVWVALYKSELLNGIRFEEGRLHEDGWFKYLPLYKAKKVTLIPDCLYYYVQERPGSIMTSCIKEKNVRDVLDAFKVRWHFFENENNTELADIAKCVYLRNLLSYYYIAQNRIEDKESAKKLSDEINKELVKYKKEILSSDYLKNSRFKFIFHYYLPALSSLLSRFRL